MANNTSQSIDFDERETEDGSSSPVRTPGFTPGGVTLPSKIIQGASPTRGAADFLPRMTEGFGPIGPDLDSEMRQQNIFGVVDSIRGVITSTRITRSLRSIAV
jgi:hypothetical protein